MTLFPPCQQVYWSQYGGRRVSSSLNVQLVQCVNDPLHDPAPKSPTLSSQHHDDWAQEMEEWGEGKLLEFEGEEDSLVSDAKEEQQDKGDQKLSPSEGEASIEVSLEKGEQKEIPLQFEPRDPEFARGARRRVSPPASRVSISGRGSRSLPPHIEWWSSVSSALLQDWHQPEQEAVESEELSIPGVVLEQQTKLDSGVGLDQHLDQAQTPLLFNVMGRLITPSVAQGLESSLQFTNHDQMAEHRFSMDGPMGDAHSGGLPVQGNRDNPSQGTHPRPLAMGDFNPSQGRLFPETVLEKLDLSSLVEDLPEDVRERILLAVEESHLRNIQRVQALDLETSTPQQPAWSTAAGRRSAGLRR